MANESEHNPGPRRKYLTRDMTIGRGLIGIKPAHHKPNQSERRIIPEQQKTRDHQASETNRSPVTTVNTRGERVNDQSQVHATGQHRTFSEKAHDLLTMEVTRSSRS